MGSNKMLRAGLEYRLGERVTQRRPLLYFAQEPGRYRGSLMGRSRVSIHAAAAIAILLLSACDPPPLVTAVDTLCVSTSRPVITEAQRAAFKADQPLWEPLVDWLGSFLKVRDGACLKPVSGA